MVSTSAFTFRAKRKLAWLGLDSKAFMGKVEVQQTLKAGVVCVWRKFKGQEETRVSRGQRAEQAASFVILSWKHFRPCPHEPRFLPTSGYFILFFNPWVDAHRT